MLPYRYLGNEEFLIPHLALPFEPRHLILPGHQWPISTGKDIFPLEILFKSASKLVLRQKSIRFWHWPELTLEEEWLFRKKGGLETLFPCHWLVLRYTDRQHRATYADKNCPICIQVSTMAAVSAAWHAYSCSWTATASCRQQARDKTNRQSIFFFPAQMVYLSPILIWQNKFAAPKLWFEQGISFNDTTMACL